MNRSATTNHTKSSLISTFTTQENPFALSLLNVREAVHCGSPEASWTYERS